MNLRDARSRAVRIRASFEGLLDALPSLVNVLILALGAIRVRDGFLSVGELSGFIYLFTLLVFPLRIIGYVLSEIPHSLSGWLRLREVLDEDELVDPRSLLKPCRDPIAISARGVSYRYPDSVNEAIKDLSFDVESGSLVAVVGSTGSGKTTLLRLLAGSLTPRAGHVCVSDTAASVVFQEPFVFSGTIRENIVLAPTSPENLEQAVHVASLKEFITSLPQDLDTEVGERGVSMSGGQRQRLALARAIAKDSRLLLIDDTTSALDPATENAVLERIASMEPRRTVVMVASRPSAVALADSVLFLEEGKLVDQGPPQDLLQRNERYREQMLSYQIDRSLIGTDEGCRHVE
jgi:ABC-type multidrug transport system fused ATPase/permease subunit